jgi:hypothetical protein
MSMNPKDEKVKSDKYTRDGAKYICKKCKGKHFSKEDVEKCFDSHAGDAPKKP